MSQSASRIDSFTSLYQRVTSDRPFVSSLLSGHLAIEFLLRRLVQQYDPRLSAHADTLRHHALISLNHQIGTISEAQHNVLNSVNKLRNKLAHQIEYEPTVHELRLLWQQAGAAFTDLTDGISQGIEALETATTIDELDDWVFSELFVQICYDLHHQYVDRGGDWDSL